MQDFLSQAEFKIKSWIIKYGRQESLELMLRDYAVSLRLVCPLSISFKMHLHGSLCSFFITRLKKKALHQTF